MMRWDGIEHELCNLGTSNTYVQRDHRRVLLKPVSAVSERFGLEVLLFLRTTLCPVGFIYSLIGSPGTSGTQHNADSDSALIRAQHSRISNESQRHSITYLTPRLGVPLGSSGT